MKAIKLTLATITLTLAIIACGGQDVTLEACTRKVHYPGRDRQ